MTIESLIALALYTLAAWFVTDHLMTHNKREAWEQYPDLGEVDIHDSRRNREAQAADDARLVDQDRSAKLLDLRTRVRDDVTRRERMRNHPQRITRQ